MARRQRRNALTAQTEQETTTLTATNSLPVAQIRMDGGTQMRQMIDETTVQEYAEAMTAGDRFPAVTVFYDGTDYWLGDGFHRVRAVEQIEQTEIGVDIRAGTRRDAVLHAVGANKAHGLRRTNEDKRVAVLALLEDKEWSQWSDREIARRCAVSQPFVSKVRSELALSDNGYQIPSERKVRRGGQEYTITQPDYVSVAELEQGIHRWINEEHGDSLPDQIAELEQAKQLGSAYENMLASDYLPAPRRKKDVKQALNNVLEQLRQRLVDNDPAPEQKKLSGAKHPRQGEATDLSGAKHQMRGEPRQDSTDQRSLDTVATDLRQVLVDVLARLDSQPQTGESHGSNYRILFGEDDWGMCEDRLKAILKKVEKHLER